MDAIQAVKPKDSQTLMLDFNMKTGATHYIIRVQSANGFYREDTVSSSPAEIKSLTPYTEYTLSTLAVNSGGRSQPSPSVTEKTGTVVHHSMCEQDVRFFINNASTSTATPNGCFMCGSESRFHCETLSTFLITPHSLQKSLDLLHCHIFSQNQA